LSHSARHFFMICFFDMVFRTIFHGLT
jgi:hypothetical protein